jgi:hypothetical protein
MPMTDPLPGSSRNVHIGHDANDNVIITGDSNQVFVYLTQTQGDTERREVNAQTRNPYRGLSAFDEKDGEWFFGRESLVERLWNRLAELHGSNGRKSEARILPVLGPSGSGKSSVVRAGLVPELAARSLPGSNGAYVTVLTPSYSPLESLAAALARVVTNDPLPIAKSAELQVELAKQTGTETFEGLRRISSLIPGISTRPLILLIDQFEEVFTLCEDVQVQAAFIGNLVFAASHPGRVDVILTMRSDFIRDTQAFPDLNRIVADNEITVPVMNENELRRAIANPAKRANRPLEFDVVESLVRQTYRREGALPLLQFALGSIWDGLLKGIDPARTLDELGGVATALAREAQRLYERLDERGKQIARRAFLAMVNVEDLKTETRRRVDLSDPYLTALSTRDHLREVLRTFSQQSARIVTLAATTTGEETAEITHEALITHWTTLRDWLEPARADLVLCRRVRFASRYWEEQGRPDGLLWRSPDFELLQTLVNGDRGEFSAEELTFSWPVCHAS